MVLESEVCTKHDLLSLVMCHAVMHVNILVSELSFRVSEGRLLWCAARPDYVSELMVQALVPPGFCVNTYGMVRMCSLVRTSMSVVICCFVASIQSVYR